MVQENSALWAVRSGPDLATMRAAVPSACLTVCDQTLGTLIAAMLAYTGSIPGGLIEAQGFTFAMWSTVCVSIDHTRTSESGFRDSQGSLFSNVTPITHGAGFWQGVRG